MDTNSRPSPRRVLQARSMGVKLIAVGVLALAMTLPALLVDGVVEDRTQRAAEVSESIASAVGGPQIFLGPVLAMPFLVPDASGVKRQAGIYVIFPERANAAVTTKSEVRHRSLFKVTVYASTIGFQASFNVPSTFAALPPSAELDWSRAEFIAGASDSRGALADATLVVEKQTERMAPSGLIDVLSLNSPKHPGVSLKVFGSRAGITVKPEAKFDLAASMKFSGAQRLVVLPFGKTTAISIRGDWPHPSFDGGFLPVSQDVSASGFKADWAIPFIARGVSAEGRAELIASLMPIAPGVSFPEMADPYQFVTRSVKYAFLFLCLVFSAFFVFEVTTGKRVHPAQYFLVGVAQLIFYLLLLSIAERIGFSPAFAIASAATVGLISINAGWIFESRIQGFRALMVFSLVYALIYLLLTLEDLALLIGSIASFLATAAIMYFTRSIDWYSDGSLQPSRPQS